MPLHKGDTIGAYEVVSTLGQGGMATVYKAYHARLNRFVAIKMIHQVYLQDPNYLARFEREAQIVAALEHPHIVPVYDFSEHEGEPYLVMKLIEGSTLKAILADGELPVDDILAVITPIASALDYAHSRSVLHRDIKPSNIILDARGTPFLTDFGLARLSLSGASTLSQDLMIGTPYYMSPEQASGKGELDARADLYSFGVVVYELFVGTVPFSEGTPYSIINDHILRELPLPTSLNPNVPPAIEAVLLQALAKDREDRYQSAAEMVAAVRRAVKAEAPRVSFLTQGRQSVVASMAKQAAPAQTTPATATRPAKKTAPMPQAQLERKPRRSYLVEAILIAVVLLLAIALVVAVISRSTPTVLIPQPTAVAQQATVLITLPPRTAEPIPTPSPPPQPTLPPQQRPPPPTVPPFDVPPMTLEQARNVIQRNPNDPVGYLALARAQLQNNNDLGATRTLADGLSHTPDPVRFEMTAADLALQIGRYDAAFSIYCKALQAAQNTPPYPAVRDAAGQYLYHAATLSGRLTIAQIHGLDQEFQNNTSPIVSAMIGRAFLTSGFPQLAEIGIDKALAEDNSLAEAHLVNGELQHAQGHDDQARAEWQFARDSADAPTWVHDQASQLLNTLT